MENQKQKTFLGMVPKRLLILIGVITLILSCILSFIFIPAIPAILGSILSILGSILGSVLSILGSILRFIAIILILFFFSVSGGANFMGWARIDNTDSDFLYIPAMAATFLSSLLWFVFFIGIDYSHSQSSDFVAYLCSSDFMNYTLTSMTTSTNLSIPIFNFIAISLALVFFIGIFGFIITFVVFLVNIVIYAIILILAWLVKWLVIGLVIVVIGIVIRIVERIIALVGWLRGA